MSGCFRFTPVVTRRDMLRLSANSFGLLAFADLLRAADTPFDSKNPLAVRSALRSESQAHYLPLHARRTVAG